MVKRLISAILNMPPKHIWRYLPVAAFVGVMPLVPLAYFTSRNPIYCNHCHKKSQEPELWRHSKVHPVKVTCIDCHATSRGLILRDFSADPSRVDVNCMRCHEDAAGIGELGFSFNANPLDIKIPHQLHVLRANVGCTDCHYNIVHDRRKIKTNRPTMQTCLDKCHTGDADNCLKCHRPGTVPPPAASTLQTDTCRNCHSRFLSDSLSFAGRKYQHSRHIENGILCGYCHSNAEKHGTMLITGDDCDRCHSLKKPESHMQDWRKIHGESAKVAPETCQGCHQKRFCTACHELRGKRQLSLMP